MAGTNAIVKLAQLKTEVTTKQNQLNAKKSAIAKVHSDKLNIENEMKRIEHQQGAHEGLVKQLSDRFNATVQQMMKAQHEGDMRLADVKNEIEKSKHTRTDLEASMAEQESKLQAEIEDLTATKEAESAKVTEQRMEAEAAAQKTAESHAKNTKECADGAEGDTAKIYAMRESAAAADEKNAAQQQAIAEAVMKVHIQKDEEAAAIQTQITEVEGQVAQEYGKTSTLTKEKAAKFQMMVETVAAEEKEAFSASEMKKETDSLTQKLAELEHQVANLDAQKVAKLKDQTKDTALAVARQERAEAEVGNMKVRGMAKEAAARLKEQKEVAKLEKEKCTAQTKIAEVQATHQERSEQATAKIQALRTELSAKDQEIEELETMYRSIRNDLKDASAKLCLAQPEKRHSVPITPAAGIKKARDEEDEGSAKRPRGSGKK